MNGSVIYASIAGFGFDGPYVNKPVFDPLIQAASGLTTVQAGADDQRPRLVRTILPDKLTGIQAAQAVSAALYRRAMQGTGSHDTTVTDKFYSDTWICERGAPGIFDEPLYRYPAMAYQAQVHAACNLGLARAAIEQAKSVSGAAKLMAGHARLCDRGYFLTGIAEAEAALRGARAFFYEAAEEAWDYLLQGDPVPLEHTNLLRLSASNAAKVGAQIVQKCYTISGMGVIAKGNPMQRYLRDAMVVTQHAAVTDMTIENAGRVLAGLDAPRGYP